VKFPHRSLSDMGRQRERFFFEGPAASPPIATPNPKPIPSSTPTPTPGEVGWVTLTMVLALAILVPVFGFLLWKRYRTAARLPATLPNMSQSEECQRISDTYLVLRDADFSDVTTDDRRIWIERNCNTVPSDLPCQGISNLFGTKPGSYGDAPKHLRDKWDLKKCATKPTDCQHISDAWGAGKVAEPPWFLGEHALFESLVWRRWKCTTKPPGLMGTTRDGSIVAKDSLQTPWRLVTASVPGVAFTNVTRASIGEMMAYTLDDKEGARLFLAATTSAAYGNLNKTLPDGSRYKKTVAGPSLAVSFIELGENGAVWISAGQIADLGTGEVSRLPRGAEGFTSTTRRRASTTRRRTTTRVPAKTTRPTQQPVPFKAITWGTFAGETLMVALDRNRNLWTRSMDLAAPWARRGTPVPMDFEDLAFCFGDDALVGLFQGRIHFTKNLQTWGTVAETPTYAIASLG
jgi:hypothetical protein